MPAVDVSAELSEAREHQAALADVLAAIANASSDAGPVLETILRHAVRLCSAEYAVLWRADGDSGVCVARSGDDPRVPKIGDRADPARMLPARRILRGDDLVHIPDLSKEPDRTGAGTVFPTRLGVAIRIDGQLYGWMNLVRATVRPFSDREIELVRTFATQAALAIKNVRLFNETKEALDQQTAISEILRVISSSPTDVQPVLDAIADSAMRFCAAEHALVNLVDGDRVRPVAGHLSVRQPFVLDRQTVTGRSIVDTRTYSIRDLADLSHTSDFPLGHQQALASGERAIVSTPLVRDGRSIGAIVLWRTEPSEFTEKQVQLVETFARQAIIAIENVRLFNETKESLEQQTAVAEILKTISRSAFDLRPVLETLIEQAARLCEADYGSVHRWDGSAYRTAAFWGPELTDEYKQHGYTTPRYPGRDTLIGRTALTRDVVHIPDVLADPEYAPRDLQSLGGYRTVLGVPLVREGFPIGVFGLMRNEVKPFTDRQIDLVRTFADQAAIAIENVRLFNEIKDKSQQLEVASRHKSEFLANMSHELRTPLNAIIGFTDVMIQEMFGPLNEKQKEYLEDVRSSGTHLLTLINDILDLSKIEAGRVDLEPTEFSLAEAIEETIVLVRERAARHGIRLAADVSPDVGTVTADQRKIKQIVVNLLSNAVKFTPDGGWVGITARCDGQHVDVAVRDTGIGIAQEDQTRIFEEFQQVGKDPERSREGTGLGLALAKRYVELHGGRIWVESEVGEGSTFTFSIPMRQTAAAPAGG